MPSNSDSPYIRLEQLTYSYQEGTGGRLVLDGVSESVTRGETVALLGRSGSGKSTLLNLIGGIDLPASGRVLIGDVDIGALDERARTLFRRAHIGFVYQFFNLIPTLSVLENLLLPLELNGWSLDEGKQRALGLLQAVGLKDRAEAFPDQLSGGEQQRVAVARALVHDPDLILADEPTGNLDLENGGQVLDLLQGLAREEGRTLIIVTHSQAVAERADRILYLRQGRLAEAGEMAL